MIEGEPHFHHHQRKSEMLLERLHLLSADMERVNVIGINIHRQQRRNKTLNRDEELFSLIGNSYEGRL